MRFLLIISILLTCQGIAYSAEVVTHSELRKELLTMEVLDQKHRMSGNIDEEKQSDIDAVNLDRLKEIVKEYGWPTISMVGQDGAQATWLIVQHADSDRVFQGEVLTMMAPLSVINEVSLETFAYLYDRINIPQRYGTQGTCLSEGLWEPREIEDRERVDERRQNMNMGSLDDYIESVSRYLCTSNQESVGLRGL